MGTGGKPKNPEINLPPIATLSYTNPPWTGLESNPKLRDGLRSRSMVPYDTVGGFQRCERDALSPRNIVRGLARNRGINKYVEIPRKVWNIPRIVAVIFVR